MYLDLVDYFHQIPKHPKVKIFKIIEVESESNEIVCPMKTLQLTYRPEN